MKYEKDIHRLTGIHRLTLVLSILVGPMVFCILCIAVGLPNDLEDGIGPFILLGILGFAVVWVSYFVVLWIIRGFRDDEKKQVNGKHRPK